MRRHFIILAFIARHVIVAAVDGACQGYRVTRSELGDLALSHAIDAALRAWRTECERLPTTACAVGLVKRALLGETSRPRLLGGCVEVQLVNFGRQVPRRVPDPVHVLRTGRAHRARALARRRGRYPSAPRGIHQHLYRKQLGVSQHLPLPQPNSV